MTADRTLTRNSLTVQFAQRLSRMLTWGMDESRRTRFLLESDADWEMMRTDYVSRRVLMRALRGIPAVFLGRMNDREITGIPPGVALAAMATAAMYAGVFDGGYPVDIRIFVTLFAIGSGVGSLMLIRNPRRIEVTRLRLPSLMIAVSLIGIALNMPTEADWPYQMPFVDTVLGDVLMVTGFVTAAISCLIIFTATFTAAHRRPLLRVGGAGGIAGMVIFAAGLMVWGFVATRVDLALTVSAVGVGLGGFALAHVLPRLRHLDIV